MNRRGALDVATDFLSRASPVYVRRRTPRWIPALAALAVLGAGVSASAADSDNTFESYTDEELSVIASDWESLTSEQRRDYFIEVRRRMAEAGKERVDPAQLPQIVGERRFGRIIRQPDGSVLHIEGVVRYRNGARGAEDVAKDGANGGERQAQAVSQTDAPPDYGTGFEQRVEQASGSAQEPRPATAPVVSVATDRGVRQSEEDTTETTTGEQGSKDGGRE